MFLWYNVTRKELLLKAADPRVTTTFNKRSDERAKKEPSNTYIVRKEGDAMFFISIATLVLFTVQVGIQVVEFILKWCKK